jgi:hypothetical protein
MQDSHLSLHLTTFQLKLPSDLVNGRRAATLYKDQNGLDIHAPDASMAMQLDQSIGRLIHFDYRITDPVLPALRDMQFFPMAHALNAYLGGLSTDPQLARKHTDALIGFRVKSDGYELTARESGHLQAAEALLCGNLSGAARALAGISMSHPLDTIALAVGHQVDLQLGDAISLRDRIGAALPFWTDDNCHYPALLGMYAFGLEETGRWKDAEQVGARAADMDAENVWAIHAVAHSFEMRARCNQGVRWLDSRRDCWTRENQMRSHLWWHYCLYLLEIGNVDDVLGIYDQSMAPEKIDHAPAKLVNGSSMLWRLYLHATDVRDRFADLAQAWRPRTQEAWCAFNDMHAVMCYVGEGDLDGATALISDRQNYIATAAGRTDNVAMTAEIGLPVCKALLAFGRERHDEVVDLLYPIRRALERCGGSHAQQDVIQQTLVEAARRAGRWRDAQELAGERLAIRPGSGLNWIKNGDLSPLGGEA